MKYYQIDIAKTAKPMGRPKNGDNRFSAWEKYDHEIEKFKTLSEAREWLKNEYGNCKRIRSYRDTAKGSEAVGYIYCFKSEPYSYDDCHHFEQHWVDISLVHKTIINFK